MLIKGKLSISELIIIILASLIGLFVLSVPVSSSASFPKYSEEYYNFISNKEIILNKGQQSFHIETKNFPNWFRQYPKYYFKTWSVHLSEKLNTGEYDTLSSNIEVKYIWGLDKAEIIKYLNEEIAHQVKKERSDVGINKDKNGNIVFDGVGFNGEQLNTEKTFILLKYAIENEVTSEIELPIIKENAHITIDDKELSELGIKEIVAVGESDFRGSSWSRISNITVGSAKLGGKVLMPGEIYSVGENLGPVNASTGFKQELVIKGSKTVPEYGGGLCQVSSTLFRGALNAGLTITERINHSYAVSYYKPWGTDATIYPPRVDLKFENNMQTPILIQNYLEGKKLYFILYGVNDGRKTELYGPYLSNWRSAPAPRVEYTDSLAPGEKKFFGEAHTGFDATWYRFVHSSTGAELISETIFSRYQARPLYYAIGQEPEEGSDEGGDQVVEL